MAVSWRIPDDGQVRAYPEERQDKPDPPAPMENLEVGTAHNSPGDRQAQHATGALDNEPAQLGVRNGQAQTGEALQQRGESDLHLQAGYVVSPRAPRSHARGAYARPLWSLRVWGLVDESDDRRGAERVAMRHQNTEQLTLG
jgi:hypothetical protein